MIQTDGIVIKVNDHGLATIASFHPSLSNTIAQHRMKPIQ